MFLEQYSSPLYLKKCKNLSFDSLLNIFAIYGHVILMCFSRLLYKIQRCFCNTIDLQQAFRVESFSHQRNVVSLSVFYKDFHGNSADELLSLMPWLDEFNRSTRVASGATVYCRTWKILSPFQHLFFFSQFSHLEIPTFYFPNIYSRQKC